MRKSLGIVVAVSLLVFACRGNSHLNRKDQQYDVVNEGSANGVTSTINGPGENAPPVNPTPITGTSANADTTTSFTLPTATEGNPVGPGSLAGTLPPHSSGSTSGMQSVPQAAAPVPAGTPQMVRPTPRPRPVPPRTTTVEPTTTQAPPPPQHTQPRPPSATPAPQPPPTDTQTPPPSTDTSSTTTDTSGHKEKQKPENPPTQTDTNPPPDEQKPQPPPPPPPTSTNAIG